jgi:hypothetical protein
MASTYSTSLKLTLIGDGDQSGIWGQTTNTNLGTLLEQAITGVVSIVMTDTNYTLTSFNGITDEARNAVLVVTGTNNAVRDLIPPVVEKVYTVVNNTTGGYAIRVIGASGTGVTIPNGATCLVYCDGTNFVSGLSGTPGNFSVNGILSTTGNASIAGSLSATNLTASANLSASNAVFTGTVTSPTPANGTNTTQIATTAFVNNTVTIATASLGTMSTQNANAVTITGGSITGITDLAVADGGTGASTFTANRVVLGNGTGALNGNMVAPGSSGNALVSNGTTWISGLPSIRGLGFGGETWQDATGTFSINTTYTNNYGYPIAMSASWSVGSGQFIVNGVSTALSTGANGNTENGIFIIIPTGASWSFSRNNSQVNFWGMLV